MILIQINSTKKNDWLFIIILYSLPYIVILEKKSNINFVYNFIKIKIYLSKMSKFNIVFTNKLYLILFLINWLIIKLHLIHLIIDIV